MKLPSTAKPEVVTAKKDQNRPVLSQLFLRIIERTTGRGRNRKTVRQGYIEATNSYVLVRIPVELDEEDEEGFILVEAWERARKDKARKLLATKDGLRTTNVTFDREHPGSFPDTDNLLVKPETCVAAIGITPQLLVEAAKALGAEKVRLEFQGEVAKTKAGRVQGYFLNPHKPIRVLPLATSSEGEAALMPVKLMGEQPVEREGK